MDARDAQKDLAVCEAATPGRWTYMCYPACVYGPDGDRLAQVFGNLILGGEPEQNAAFIALARSALPYWIHRAIEAEKMVLMLSAEVAALIEYGSEPQMVGGGSVA